MLFLELFFTYDPVRMTDQRINTGTAHSHIGQLGPLAREAKWIVSNCWSHTFPINPLTNTADALLDGKLNLPPV